MPPSTRRRGRPRRTPAERAEQRDDLIRGAIAAVRSDGADQSMDALAAAMGVSKPVVYGEFGGRTGLADAIAVVLADQIQQAVFTEVAAGRPVVVDDVIRAIIDAIVTLTETEPELYRFLISAAFQSGRGLLDNALVRALHDRTTLVLGSFASLPVDEMQLSVLLDGLYGFVLGSIESWQTSRRPDRDTLVETLTTVIGAGMRSIS